MTQLRKDKQLVLTLSQLRNQISNIEMPEGTKELLLIHFEEVGHLHKFSVELNGEQIECYKITDDAYPVKGGFYVSEKERATMLLQLNVEQISLKLETLAQKIFSSHEEAAKLLKVKRKNKAKLMLRQEHTYHNYWESFAVLKHQLENQLSKIDALEGNQSLETTFKLAEAAHKSIKTDLKEVEEVLKNIDMRMEEQDDINPQVQNSSVALHPPIGRRDLERTERIQRGGQRHQQIPRLRVRI